MRTQGTRWRSALVGLVIVACGHAPPPRVPEPDDDRAGATELVWSESEEQFFADGTIDASTGDVIDWYTLTLPADGPRRFTVYVQGTGKTGRLPVAVDVFDADVQQIGRIAVESETTSQVAYRGGWVARGRAYIRISALAGSTVATFRVAIQNVVAPPPPEPPACDPHNWDARNPSCAHVCNLDDPDLRTPQCCDIMRPCSGGIAVGMCVGSITAFADGRFTASIGRADVGVDFLTAYLVEPIGEPQVFSPSGRDITALDHSHPLTLISADDHSSVWELRTSHGHDVVWLGANATRIEIPPPPVCRGGDYIPRRR
jgi:hypothetical protein